MRVRPTFDDFLAKGYIKAAHALSKLYRTKLINNFGEDNILIAPIKYNCPALLEFVTSHPLRQNVGVSVKTWESPSKRRTHSICKAKLNEIKEEGLKKVPPEGPPYASRICDFLRSTILCDSILEMVLKLEELSKVFKITRVKERLNPNATGNKVLLVNLVVIDPALRPCVYPWSGWWDNQPVQMIGEVQIALREIFYLDKQAHSTYEIKRTQTCKDLIWRGSVIVGSLKPTQKPIQFFLEWEYQQGYENVEQQMFRMSPLHNNPLCLL